MTLEQYAYLGQIIAAIAVVASLVYIGTELRQNTQALEAQSRFNLVALRTGIIDILVQDRGLLEALHKYTQGEELSRAERTAVMVQAFRLLETWEWQYGEFQAGTLPRDRLPVGSWRQLYHKKIVPNALAEAWEIRKPALHPSFVEFIESNVIEES